MKTHPVLGSALVAVTLVCAGGLMTEGASAQDPPRKAIDPKEIRVAIREGYFFLNGQKLELPVPPPEVIKLLGKPSRESRSAMTILTWDDLGIHAYVDPEDQKISEIHVGLRKDRHPFSPAKVFVGKATIDDLEVTADSTAESMEAAIKANHEIFISTDEDKEKRLVYLAVGPRFEPKAAASAPAGAPAPGPAGSPSSAGDLIYDACIEMELKQTPPDELKDQRELMAGLSCQILAKGWSMNGCADNPGREFCKKTLRELDADQRASGSSMLAVAALYGRTDICKTMIAMGGDPNSAVAVGLPPLMGAANQGHEETVAALLEAGAHPNSRDKLGRTALMLASTYGRTTVVKKLLTHGADPNLASTDDKGWTALMMAADSGHLETVRTLLGGGAAPTARDKADKTALSLAKARGHSSVARLLAED